MSPLKREPGSIEYRPAHQDDDPTRWSPVVAASSAAILFGCIGFAVGRTSNQVEDQSRYQRELAIVQQVLEEEQFWQDRLESRCSMLAARLNVLVDEVGDARARELFQEVAEREALDAEIDRTRAELEAAGR